MPQPSARDSRDATVLLAVAQLLVAVPLSAVGPAALGAYREIGIWGFLADWVFSVYVTGLAIVLVGAGRRVDVAGSGTTLRTGAVLYAVGALVAGAAPSGWVVAAAILLLGVGAGFLQAAVLGEVATRRAEPARFGTALATIAAVWVAGDLAGVPFGALLVDLAGWRWVFWLLVPGAVAVVVAARALPRAGTAPAERSAGQLIWFTSVVLVGVAVVLLVELPVRGLGSVAAGLAPVALVGLGTLAYLLLPARRTDVLAALPAVLCWLCAGAALLAARVALVLAYSGGPPETANPAFALLAVVALAAGAVAGPVLARTDGARTLGITGLVLVALCAVSVLVPLDPVVVGLVLAVGAVAATVGGFAVPLAAATAGRLGLFAGCLLTARFLGESLTSSTLAAVRDGRPVLVVGIGLGGAAAAAALLLVQGGRAPGPDGGH